MGWSGQQEKKKGGHLLSIRSRKHTYSKAQPPRSTVSQRFVWAMPQHVASVLLEATMKWSKRGSIDQREAQNNSGNLVARNSPRDNTSSAPFHLYNPAREPNICQNATMNTQSRIVNSGFFSVPCVMSGGVLIVSLAGVLEVGTNFISLRNRGSNRFRKMRKGFCESHC